MKNGHFLVTLVLILSLLTFDILPASQCTHPRTIVSVRNLDLSEILQVSKEYLPASLSSALLVLKSKPQIPSWHGRLLLEFPLWTHHPVSHFLSEVFLLSPTILQLISSTVLRC